MFDKYMILEDSLRTTPSGFELDIRITYYRGVPLSMIEALDVTVDDREVPREAIRFVLRGTAYTLDELEQRADTRWDFGEIATLSVQWPNGLAPGEHTIAVTQMLRIPYLPTLLRGADTKAVNV